MSNPETPHRATELLRLPAILARVGWGRSTFYLRIKQGLWPRPIALGPRSVAQPDYEVDALIAARIAGKTDEEIRALVIRLHAERTT